MCCCGEIPKPSINSGNWFPVIEDLSIHACGFRICCQALEGSWTLISYLAIAPILEIIRLFPNGLKKYIPEEYRSKGDCDVINIVEW